MTIKTASDLKYYVEQSGQEPHFFDRKTMKFFGDRMANYGVRRVIVINLAGERIDAYELFRRRAVKHQLQDSAYFDASTFSRVFAKKEF